VGSTRYARPVTLDDAREIFAELARQGVEYVLVGSMAMAAQGLPRATQDLDLFVAPDEENVKALKRALQALFDDPDVKEIDPEELAGAYPAIQYIPPHGRYSLDILTRLGEMFRWEDLLAASEMVEIGDVKIRVATPRMLFRMKRDTVRPQDRVDAARIREAFGLEES
jgi:hypothetical protein